MITKNMCKLNEKYSTPSESYTDKHSNKSLKFKSLPILEKKFVTNSSKIGASNSSDAKLDVKNFCQTIILEKNKDGCTTKPFFSNFYSNIQKKEILKSVKKETISLSKCNKSNSTLFSTTTKKSEESFKANLKKDDYLKGRKNSNDLPHGINQHNIFTYSSLNNCPSCKEDIVINDRNKSLLLNKKNSKNQNQISRNTEKFSNHEFLSANKGKNKNENCVNYHVKQNSCFQIQNRIPCNIKSENEIDLDHQFNKKISYETITKDGMYKSKLF